MEVLVLSLFTFVACLLWGALFGHLFERYRAPWWVLLIVFLIGPSVIGTCIVFFLRHFTSQLL